MEQFQIAVVGGGAAGLMAAAQAARQLQEPGAVVVLEGADRVGKKLLATGNGRCNLTNRYAQANLYHGGANCAQALFAELPPAQVLQEFERMGLFCREEEQGRVYPQNGQASAVLDALRLFLQKHGVTECCGSWVTQIQKEKKGFVLQTSIGNTFFARRVIVAQGGKASPQISSDGGFFLPGQLGHTTTRYFPALVQVTVPPHLVKALKGVRSPASVTFLADGKAIKTEQGELQFTEYGLSGVCMFQLSRLAAEFSQCKTVRGVPCEKAEIAVDVLPAHSFAQACDLLSELGALYPQLPVRELLFGVLQKRVGQQLVAFALGKQAVTPAGSLTQAQKKTLAAVLKRWVFPVTGVLPWKNAQVTAGGVPMEEVHVPSMESKRCPGIYLAGEQLDIDGDCGGFNLHWAWISGMAAGRSAAQALKEERRK